MTLYNISHTTRYGYEGGLSMAIQRLLLTPKSSEIQEVKEWHTHLEGAKMVLEVCDHHQNIAHICRYIPPSKGILIRVEGKVKAINTNGIVGKHDNALPLGLFKRSTSLTQIGKNLRLLLREVKANMDCSEKRQKLEPIVFLHELSAQILLALPYQKNRTNNETSAEDALEIGAGVCQDHVHTFLALVRHFGYPARYISGYLMMFGVAEQQAMHAWAEVFVPHVGWVGFDISNQISPDHHYIRVATGFDYRDILPVAGVRSGVGAECLDISIQVQQQ